MPISHCVSSKKPCSYQSDTALVTSLGLEPSTAYHPYYTPTPWMVCISSREPISLFACYTLLCSSSCLESYSSFPFPDFPGSLEHLSPPLVLSLKVTFVVLPALTVYTGPPLSHSNHSSGLFLAQILSLLIVIYLVICVLALLIFPSHSY